MCFLTWIRSLLLSSPTPSAAAAAAAVCSTSRSSNSNKTRTTSSVVYTLDMGVSECAIRSSVQSSPQGKMGMSPHQHQCHCCAAHAAVVVQQGHHHHHHHHHSGHGHSHSHNHNHNQMIKMNNNHHHHHHQHQQQDVVVQPVTTSSSSSNDSNILAPLKSKMRVLKKLKRKMGLAPRSSNAGTNNLPPLTFHQVHGDNIRLCNGNTIAKRYESFCKGVTFSARPVRVGEKVCVKFLEISNNWSGVIRFGFTSNDPVNLRSGLPRYACPDLTNKPGYWAKALAERFAECDSVLFYYVTSAGDVHFGVNGEEKGVFFSGVETRGPLWAVIDVYGNSTAIEFVDPNRQHFNNVRRGAEHSNEDNAQHSRHSAMDDAANAGRDIDRIIVPAMQTVSIHHEQPDVALPGLRFQPQGVLFAPLPFHPTRGRNIKFSNNQCVATRSDTEFCHGYAFTSRPLVLGERLVVQILATENMYVGALALGLTSCDPARLTADDLPDDSDLLLDRPEYWVVSKDVASSPQPGDEIAFTVTHYGEVQMSKNGGPPNVVMHVDQSLQLWAFVDVYGSTQRVRMLASRPAPSSPPRQRQQMAPAPVPTTVLPAAAAEISRFSDVVQLKPPVPGGTVLVVNLPPQTSYLPAPAAATAVSSPQPIYGEVQRNSRQSTPSQPTGTMASTGSSTYVDPVTYQTLDTSQAATSSSSQQQQQHLQQWSEGLQPTPGQPSECSICYERTIDSVLYMCGHMCMCYTCALQQWRGKGGGHCPLCRATIRDVIRIYRS